MITYFHYFAIISPWKRAKINSSPNDLSFLCQFGCNWACVSGEEDENVFGFLTDDGREDKHDHLSKSKYLEVF